jgi:hypothetical protein
MPAPDGNPPGSKANCSAKNQRIDINITHKMELTPVRDYYFYALGGIVLSTRRIREPSLAKGHNY